MHVSETGGGRCTTITEVLAYGTAVVVEKL
jgi:uncharacterized protein YbjQ (UPF0145 family)